MIRVDTMPWPWLAVKMVVIFHFIRNIMVFGNPLINIKTNNLLVVTRIFQEENPVLLVRCCLPCTQKLQCYVVQ